MLITLARLRNGGTERGSLPLVMLMSIVSASLGALLLPTLVSQNNSTRSDVRSVHALHAAQTGVELALGQVRAASVAGSVRGALVGVIRSLPCGPFRGPLDSTGNATFTVNIQYLPSDPVGQTTGWINAHALACSSSAGVAVAPAFALFTSTGSETFASKTATRTISSTYVFKTTNANIPGGPINNGNYCWDAGSDAGIGSQLTIQSCASGLTQQKFIYSPDLTLQLANSASPAAPNGLCLDGTNSHDVRSSTVPISLQPCQPSSAYAQAGVTYSTSATAATCGPTAPTAPNCQPLYRQQWGFYGNTFKGALPPNGPTQTEGDGTCITPQTFNFAGSPLVIRSCGDAAIISVDPTVGAGRAGLATQQYVNFKQFGRCLDVQGEDVNNPLITYPCKQVPYGLTDRDWNQAWVYDPVRLTMTTYQNGANPYCLKSPLSIAQIVTVASCPAAGSAVPSALQWTQHTDTSLRYAEQATITDNAGNCLAPNPTFSGFSGLNASRVIVDKCDGSTIQKWNADPNLNAPSPLQNTGEH